MKVAACLLALPFAVAPARAADDYKLGPDSSRRRACRRAGSTARSLFKSTIFRDTVRDYWVYVPAQYDAAKPAA